MQENACLALVFFPVDSVLSAVKHPLKSFFVIEPYCIRRNQPTKNSYTRDSGFTRASFENARDTCEIYPGSCHVC